MRTLRLLPFLVLAGLTLWSALCGAQAPPENPTLKDFAGTWECHLEGKLIVRVTLEMAPTGDSMTGTLGNMTSMHVDTSGKLLSGSGRFASGKFTRVSLRSGQLHFAGFTEDKEPYTAKLSLTAKDKADLIVEGTEGIFERGEPIRIELRRAKN